MLKQLQSTIALAFMLLLLALPAGYAQKITLPQMGGSLATRNNGDLLQVEADHGVILKIDYTFNPRQQKVSFANKDYYPTLHDQIKYSATSGRLVLIQGGYTLAGTKNILYTEPGKIRAYVMAGLPPDGHLKKAIDDFIAAVADQIGPANDQTHLIRVLQVSASVLQIKIQQLLQAI